MRTKMENFIIVQLLMCSFALKIALIEAIDEKCPPLFSTSQDIECFYRNNKKSCSEPSLHNTIAKLKCKDFYYRQTIPYDSITCLHGRWDKVLFNCKSVCGIKTSKGIPQVISGYNAMKGQFPWHIGLYKLSNNDYKYQCGGSIISEKLVITAAHCIYDFKPREYYVAAGKYYKEWSNDQDKHAQFREVIHLVSPERYTGADTLFTADIAILITRKGFEFTNFIRPVCVDFEENFFRKIRSGNKKFGEVPGWGLTSEDGSESKQLNYATLPIKGHRECLITVPIQFKMHVTADKICAGYTNGTSICQGDSGGGLVYPRVSGNSQPVYYVVGLVSTKPFKNGTCDSFSYTTFTEIEHYKQWINETVFKFEAWSPYDYGCLLPSQPEFGNYVVETMFSEDSDKHIGELVQQYTTLKYECNSGYRLTDTINIVCVNNHWNNNHTLPTCSIFCLERCTPKLSSTSINIFKEII